MPELQGGRVSPAQLRRLIDTGRTKDKVPADDPAAAPLGTDAEAGAASPPRQDAAADLAAQMDASAEVPPSVRPVAASRSGDAVQRRRDIAVVLSVVLALLLCLGLSIVLAGWTIG